MFTLKKLPGTCSMYELIYLKVEHFNESLAKEIYEQLRERDNRNDITVIYNSNIAVSFFDAMISMKYSPNWDYTFDNLSRHRLLKKIGFKKVYFNKHRVLSTYILHFKDLKKILKI